MPGPPACVVVGAQWGDEGKGKLVDVLAERADLVVRYQGGANAGHTVVIGDTQFILRQIPSGILHPDVTCLIGNGVVLEPENLFAELDSLHQRGIDTSGRLFISDRAHLVLPYHKLLDAASEKSQKLGTTGRGIGPAYEDKYGRRGIRVTDLRRVECARMLLSDRVHRANQLLQLMESNERADLDEHVRLLERLAPRLLPLAADTGLLLHRAIKDRRRVLLEGAQGALLDVDHGTYPYRHLVQHHRGRGGGWSGHRTDGHRRRTGRGQGLYHEGGERTTSYRSPSPYEQRLRELGGEFGAVTGRPRRCGWFDATVVRYATRVNGLTGLAVTKLDVLDSFPEIQVGTMYRLGGELCEEIPAEVEALGRVEPVYETHAGWQRPTGTARRLADLPLLRAPIWTVSRSSRVFRCAM